MFDFGFLFRNWEVVTNAAREGARVGVLPSYDCADGSATTSRPRRHLHGGRGTVDAASYRRVTPTMNAVGDRRREPSTPAS